MRQFSLCSLHVTIPSCSSPRPPKFLPLCSSCNSNPRLERAWAKSKLCRFSILGCLWVRCWGFFFVCGFLLLSFVWVWDFFCCCCFICSFANVLLETQAEVGPGLQLRSFLLCGWWREQNGSSQDGVFSLPPSLYSGVDHCIIQYDLQDFNAKSTVSHSVYLLAPTLSSLSACTHY